MSKKYTEKEPEIYVMPDDHRKSIEKEKSSFGSFFFEVVKIVVICLAIIIPVRFFLIHPFFVRGDSMEPNFSNKEYLIIDQVSYRFSEPERGDVIVFRYPFNPSQFYIKRIIGLPGEKIEISSGQVTIFNDDYPEGKILNELYIPPEVDTPGNIKQTLDSDEYFVMGDNRKGSSDSRSWGALSEEYIIGKTWVRVFPISKAQAFGSTNYSLVTN